MNQQPRCPECELSLVDGVCAMCGWKQLAAIPCCPKCKAPLITAAAWETGNRTVDCPNGHSFDVDLLPDFAKFFPAAAPVEAPPIVREALTAVIAADDKGTGTKMDYEFAVAFQTAARLCDAALRVLGAAQPVTLTQYCKCVVNLGIGENGICKGCGLQIYDSGAKPVTQTQKEGDKTAIPNKTLGTVTSACSTSDTGQAVLDETGAQKSADQTVNTKTATFPQRPVSPAMHFISASMHPTFTICSADIGKPVMFEAEPATPSTPEGEEIIVGAFCPSIAECMKANKCLQDCQNKPHPNVIPTSFPPHPQAAPLGAREYREKQSTWGEWPWSDERVDQYTATLREQLRQWETWGIVEIAVRNPQVSEYCEHWEGRVKAAEARAEQAEKELRVVKGDCIKAVAERGALKEKAEQLQAQLEQIRHTWWLPIVSAPRNATKVRVKMKDETIHEDAHWASDLSGEEQPPFEGWFVPCGSGYKQIPEPSYWQPLPPAPKEQK